MGGCVSVEEETLPTAPKSVKSSSSITGQGSHDSSLAAGTHQFSSTSSHTGHSTSHRHSQAPASSPRTSVNSRVGGGGGLASPAHTPSRRPTQRIDLGRTSSGSNASSSSGQKDRERAGGFGTAATPSRSSSYEALGTKPLREASRQAPPVYGSGSHTSSDGTRGKGSSPRVAPVSRSSSTNVAVLEEEGERWVEGRAGEAMRRATSDLGGGKAGADRAAMAAAVAGAVKAVPTGENGGEKRVQGEDRAQQEGNANELASEGGGGKPAVVRGGINKNTAVAVNAEGGGDSRDGSANGKANGSRIVASGDSNQTSSNGSGSSSSTGQQSAAVHLSKPVREYSLDELMAATGQLARDNQLGEGGFGVVFKGRLQVATEGREGEEGRGKGAVVEVAVKVLKAGSEQGEKEWRAELQHLSRLQHPQLVRLLGYCAEGADRMIVYEYMERGSLDRHMFSSRRTGLPWVVRMKVALQAAQGLAYLHDAPDGSVIFRDFKTSNVLLDKDFNAKLSDFGLARDGPLGNKTHVTTDVIGTKGYIDPGYLVTGHLSPKSDVYSFGITLLELLTGRRAYEPSWPKAQAHILDWLRPALHDRNLLPKFMDALLKDEYPKTAARTLLLIAFVCVDTEPSKRPKMKRVVQNLKELQDSNDALAKHLPS